MLVTLSGLKGQTIILLIRDVKNLFCHEEGLLNIS